VWAQRRRLPVIHPLPSASNGRPFCWPPQGSHLFTPLVPLYLTAAIGNLYLLFYGTHRTLSRDHPAYNTLPQHHRRPSRPTRPVRPPLSQPYANHRSDYLTSLFATDPTFHDFFVLYSCTCLYFLRLRRRACCVVVVNAIFQFLSFQFFPLVSLFCCCRP
jgi:hypothetical protein